MASAKRYSGDTLKVREQASPERCACRPGPFCRPFSIPFQFYSIPSFRLSISFTACGLALPPVAFMTWPTNQPRSVGFAFACSTLSGFADDLIDRGLDRAGVGDLAQPAPLHELARVAALAPDDLEQVLGDLA